MHELEKYWTLSRMSQELGISIQRLTRLIKSTGTETYKLGAAVLTHERHLQVLREALKKKADEKASAE